MGIRTDLAMEAKALWEKSAGKTTKLAGVRARERERDGFAVTDVHILDRWGEAALGKPAGRYVTLELPPLARDVRPAAEALAAELRRLLRLQPGQGVLVAGLGNEAVTPDALGPLCLRGLFLTRHLIRHLPEQFGGVRPVSAVAPGVLATTGMESLELVRGAVRHVRPACVLAVDALAAAAPERLCRTFQLSDAGIVPGSGVGNHRNALTEETLGVPVIAIGIPTVVDAATIVGDALEKLMSGEKEFDAVKYMGQHRMAFAELNNMYMTGKDIDSVIKRVSYTVSEGINIAMEKNWA